MTRDEFFAVISESVRPLTKMIKPEPIPPLLEARRRVMNTRHARELRELEQRQLDELEELDRRIRNTRELVTAPDDYRTNVRWRAEHSCSPERTRAMLDELGLRTLSDDERWFW